MSDPTTLLIEAVKFDERGLVTAIVQDADNGEVLMVAHMNRESLAETLASGRTCFWSRSRRKLWRKGEKSGHVQRVREIRLDCDGDVVLVKVEQTGGACHTGYRSCFYRRRDSDSGTLEIDAERIFDPDDVY
jgi:phosphoribosyl-AMP cyclohydrolase